MNVHVTKTVPIELEWVVAAYWKVRQGGKAVGIDEESWAEFEKNYMNNCYVIWNRLASGSYLPLFCAVIQSQRLKPILSLNSYL